MSVQQQQQGRRVGRGMWCRLLPLQPGVSEAAVVCLDEAAATIHKKQAQSCCCARGCVLGLYRSASWCVCVCALCVYRAHVCMRYLGGNAWAAASCCVMSLAAARVCWAAAVAHLTCPYVCWHQLAQVAGRQECRWQIAPEGLCRSTTPCHHAPVSASSCRLVCWPAIHP